MVKGDTLYLIAKKYRTTVVKMNALNPKVNLKALQIGKKLRVK
ncbi:hypothetical protein CVN76_04295 [Bacillus sp. mrc49]|nr:hypothetical protein CVN76_04295 [Bacillus sp. mrc49]